MIRKEYGAGAVKFSFWFMEFRKVVQLRNDGKSFEEIKRINQEENLFGTRTPARAQQIYNTVSARVRSLDESFYPIFVHGDLMTQKQIALIAALAHDTLFFDFVYHIIREKMLIGSNEFTESDVRIFFKNVQIQDEKAAKWTEATIRRLGIAYKTQLFEAGVTDKGKEVRKIYKPLFDRELKNWLLDHDMEPMIRALTGENG